MLEDLIEKLDRNQEISFSLESNAAQRKQILASIQDYSESFLSKLNDLETYEDQGYNASELDQGFQLGEQGADINNLTSFINLRVDSLGLNPASAGHIGYIPGGGIYEAAIGDFLAGVANKYAGVFYASPGAVRMENSLIQWAGNLIGYQGNFGGNLSSGGSIANLIAISTARKAKQIKGKDIDRTVIYTTAQSHHSIQKAINICGLEECIIRHIALDKFYRMSTEDLELKIEKDKEAGLNSFMIVANAGSTDVGAIDPLKKIADIAKKYSIWLHVDAAYGGFFMLTEYGKKRMSGIEEADSVVLDPHKGLFLPYGTGMVLIKEIKHLLNANGYQANYMQDTKSHQEEYSPAELSPELSKHFRGMRMWLPLKLHGLKKFEACLEEKLGLAAYFNREVQKIGFETLAEHDLSVVVYRFVPDNQDANKFNKAMSDFVRKDGRIFISTTTLDDKFMLRVAILSFRTHQREMDILLQLLEQFVRENA